MPNIFLEDAPYRVSMTPEEAQEILETFLDKYQYGEILKVQRGCKPKVVINSVKEVE